MWVLLANLAGKHHSRPEASKKCSEGFLPEVRRVPRASRRLSRVRVGLGCPASPWLSDDLVGSGGGGGGWSAGRLKLSSTPCHLRFPRAEIMLQCLQRRCLFLSFRSLAAGVLLVEYLYLYRASSLQGSRIVLRPIVRRI